MLYKRGAYGGTGSCIRIWEAYFYNLILGKYIDTSVWQQLRRVSCSTENLEKHRDRGGDVGHIAKCKVPLRVNARSKYKVHIRLSDLGYPGCTWVGEWVKVALVERDFIRASIRRGIFLWCSLISEDSHILTAIKRGVGDTAQRTNPIVPDGLVCCNNHGVPLTDKDGYRVNFYGLHFSPIDLDDRHSVTIDCEVEERVAGNRNHAKAIS